MRDVTRVLDHLWKLRQLGVRLALDDVGTGCRSVSYLLTPEFDVIKLDKSFIGHLGAATSGALVHGVLELSRALGIATMAEGVERRDQAEELMRLRCHRRGSRRGRRHDHGVPSGRRHSRGGAVTCPPGWGDLKLETFYLGLTAVGRRRAAG